MEHFFWYAGAAMNRRRRDNHFGLVQPRSPLKTTPRPFYPDCARAFSIVELTLVIGVLAVVVSLALPSLSRARTAARQLGDSVTASEYAKLVILYSGSHKDMFPSYVAEGVPNTFATRSGGWGLELESAGLLSNARNTPSSDMPYKFTYVAFIDPKLMQPGNVPPANEVPVRTQSITNVRYPSAKGMLWPVRREDEPFEATWCCTVQAPPGAIAFVDGSVAVKRWVDFGTSEGLPVELWAGYPVISTWQGIWGIDRRSTQ